MRRLYLNKYFETLLLFSFTCLFSHKLNAHPKAPTHKCNNIFSRISLGRPFFVCSDQSNPCSFWVWGDVQHVTKPKCHHGFPCVIRKVKKKLSTKTAYSFAVLKKIHATTSNGCPKNLIVVLASPRQKSSKMKNAKNNTQQRILSTISLASRVVFKQVYSVIKNILFEQF